MITTNSRLYRVFLGESKDISGSFEIRYGDVSFWDSNRERFILTVEEQMDAMQERQVLRKSYDMAKFVALDLRDRFTFETRRNYVFIDATSRGDRRVAEIFAKQVFNENQPPIEQFNFGY